MDLYNIFCPYCGNAHDPHNYYVDGFQVIVCDGCSKPFVNQTTTTPVFHSFALVGFEEMPVYPHPAHEDVGEIIEKALRPALRQFVDSAYPTPEEIEQAIQEDPEEQLCVDCGKPISPNSDFRLCEDCLKDDDVENQPLPISTNSVFPCMVCGVMLPEKYPLSMCEDCYQNKKKADEETSRLFRRPSNSVFLQCPNAPNSLYRLDGDYVEVKYKKGSVIRTTLSDIHMMCEDENPTPTIKELLGERANTNNVAAMNAFVRAVKNGWIEVDA